MELDLSDLVIRIDVPKTIYSDFRGWMSPDGELHNLYGVDGHTALAKEFIKYYSGDPIEALHKAGWIRVVCSNSFSCAKLDDNTRKLLRGIVLRQRNCAKFFLLIGKECVELSRDSAIEYLR